MRIRLAALLALGMATAASGGPTATDALRATPAEVTLRGPDAAQQLAVERAVERPVDTTTEATFASSDPAVATVDATGLIVARGDGAATITATVGASEVRVPVTVREFVAGRPIHFGNQIVPIFTKLGCNSGGCHGKASGQNGFRLSLLGFDPALDYETLVLEGRGRRLFPTAPERSLLLLKATARVPHGGGRRLDPASHEYKLVARWIASGMPVGAKDAPTVARIEVAPRERVMARKGRQQVVVTAVYTDGTTEDVTRRAQYQSNEMEVASVADGGQVTTADQAGIAAVMARYQGRVAVFRAIVPLGGPSEGSPDFRPVNVVDELALKQWKALGIAPSAPCTDSEFLRRASLDITGTLPTPEDFRAFAADPDPEKRAKLVDRLLDRPEYASYFATRWADVLRNKREGNPVYQRGTYRFHDWIRASLANNLPYDQFARAILTASGGTETSPPVVWYRRLRQPDAFVDDTAQVFLGMRLQCAKCHHHPFEAWSQDDYYGFAAFFARVGRKPSRAAQKAGQFEEIVFNARGGAVVQPRTGQVMKPKGLAGPVLAVEPADDPRVKLADWMVAPDNPFFARALVNRYWAHFLGRGLVEPIDDMRVTNPPSNPELLDALAKDFAASGYDMKHLIRTICTSRLYGLSSLPNASNAKDKQSFARFYPKRMAAEVLLDAIAQVTAAPTDFGGLPKGTRAIELPDEAVGSTFLDAFGRPKRDTACECERVTDASLGQSLMLLNSGEVQQKLVAPSNRAETLAKDTRPAADRVADLFWAAFGRAPEADELARASAHLDAHKDNPRAAFEDILWALINAKEFQFND